MIIHISNERLMGINISDYQDELGRKYKNKLEFELAKSLPYKILESRLTVPGGYHVGT